MLVYSLLALLPAASLVRAQVVAPGIEPFALCLQGTGLKVELPTNATWDASTAAFNTRFHYTPAAIVYPTHAADVAQAVRCAGLFGVPVSPLSGGHSYAASGYGSRDGELVVAFRDMAAVTYSAAGQTAAIQPGARLGDVALALFNGYGRALAHGVCPYVGVGGHTAFGGWGFASRNWGLMIDQVVAAELVLANGTLVHVSNTQHPEILKGVRGAASSFGIVTQYTFQTHAAPSSVVRFSFSYSNPQLAPAAFAKVMGAYQTWAATVPKQMGIEANIWDSGKTIELGGYYMGPLDQFNATFTPLLKAAGEPNGRYVQERSWIDALVEVNGGSPLSTIGKPEMHSTFYAKSLVVPTANPLSPNAFSALAAYFSAHPAPAGTSWFIQFELWGGGDSQISSVPSTATAYPHRAHLFTIQFYAYATPGTWSAAGGVPFVDGLVAALQRNSPGTKFGAYANYLDPDLRDWREMYWAGNYAALEHARMSVDPHGLFVKKQSIGAEKYPV
ncbi:unnamed protein product [Mycena citricolor]|uniref:FAD-binding PCMH-type domain-containing protein n=1 Tax=Mycena citricolor TaxID=2018698 RepID=A0AAD2GXT6_9AGAR|nr:unnamed protein product [Mycena citricolor]